MRTRLARLDKIYSYIIANPYVTCAAIAEYLGRRVDLIQSDVRIMYKAGFLGRRNVDKSRKRQDGNYKAKEYYVVIPWPKRDA